MALFEEMAGEYGGSAGLSVINRTLLFQAWRLMVRSEPVKGAADAVKCLNAARRLLAGLKLDVVKAPRRVLGPFHRSLIRDPGATP